MVVWKIEKNKENKKNKERFIQCGVVMNIKKNKIEKNVVMIQCDSFKNIKNIREINKNCRRKINKKIMKNKIKLIKKIIKKFEEYE